MCPFARVGWWCDGDVTAARVRGMRWMRWVSGCRGLWEGLCVGKGGGMCGNRGVLVILLGSKWKVGG